MFRAKGFGAILGFGLVAIAVSVPATVRAQDACMIGEVRMFAGNFAPRYWALLDGQILPISQNTALFAILGTTYGGDGRTTFALPDMRGRTPMHAGSGPGLTTRRIGEKTGQETTVLNETNLPAHRHGLAANSAEADTGTPSGSLPAAVRNRNIYSTTAPDTAMNAAAIGSTGGSQPFSTVHPVQVINHIICIEGYFPSRS